MNGSMTAHCASDNQNRSAIAPSSSTLDGSESDSLSPRKTLIGFRP